MLVVGEGNQFHAGCSESLFCHRESVRKRSHHTNHFKACCTKCLDSFQTAAACRNQVFYNDNLRTCGQFTFYLVAHTVVFRFRTHIGKRHSQLVGNQCTLCDGSCSNTCYGHSLWEVLQDGVTEFQFHKRTQVGKRQCLSVVRVNR